jgi:hypothetical protein
LLLIKLPDWSKIYSQLFDSKLPIIWMTIPVALSLDWIFLVKARLIINFILANDLFDCGDRLVVPFVLLDIMLYLLVS